MTIPSIPTETFAAIAQRSQDATTTAVRSWADSLQNYVTTFSAENPLPKPAEAHAVVNTWFDLAGKLLAEQRELAVVLVDTGAETAGTLAEQALTLVRTGAAA